MKRMSRQILRTYEYVRKARNGRRSLFKRTEKNIIDYIDDDNNKKMPLEVICI
jgi:hypothetical protein